MTLSDPVRKTISFEVSAVEHARLSELANKKKLTVDELAKEHVLQLAHVVPSDRVIQTVEEKEKKK